jgi:polyisoprenoid-binding protein YceI
VLKSVCVAALALLLAGCGVPRPRQTSPPPPPAQATQPHAPGTTVYRIDPSQSELRILVHRAGAMAAFGHNHVIVNRMLSGQIEFAGSPAASSFSIAIPAAGFVVDETDLRRQEGPDFPGDIPEDAKQGTLHNMLSGALLNAAQYPAVTVRSTSINDSRDALTVTLAISVAGHESTLVAPFTLETSAGRLSAAGTLEVRQSALGLAPFSVMMGALQVQDVMRLKFRITALAT